MEVEMLKQYCRETMRHRLYFTQSEVQGMCCVDVGIELSKEIANILTHRQLPMVAEERLDRIVEKHTERVDGIGEIVALANIGILLEPALKINVQSKFDSYARSRSVIIQMRGSIIKDNRFYLAGSNDRKWSFDLTGMTYKEIQDEI